MTIWDKSALSAPHTLREISEPSPSAQALTKAAEARREKMKEKEENG